MVTLADLDDLALALPETTKEVSEDDRPFADAWLRVHGIPDEK